MEQVLSVSHFLILPLAFALTLALVPFTKVIAQRLEFVSKIDFRRNELAPRPLLGGVAIFVSVLLANLTFGFLPMNLVLPGLVLVALGMYDDKVQMSAKLKMLIEIGAVALWLALTPAESLLLVKAGLPVAAAYAAHAFWVIGLINAFNMIDGMDGLASGMATLGFAFMSIFLPDELRWFSLSLSAACLAHLVFNRPPASIFLGDSGSLLLGFLMSALGSVAATRSSSLTSVLVPLFVLAHPEIDAILAMARRRINGTPLFLGDKDHIHHKLRRIGLGPYGSLGVTYSATIYCGLTALLVDRLHSDSAVALATGLCIAGVSSILLCIYYVEHRLAAQFSQLSTPLLQRHVNITSNVEVPPNFEAAVFDLMPYYKELQMRGIADLNSFVIEFGTWVNTAFRNAQIVPVGSYSIIVITGSGLSKDQVTHSFRSLISRHQILKNGSGIPWGLKYYSHSTDAQEFEQKFGLVLRARVLESGKAA